MHHSPRYQHPQPPANTQFSQHPSYSYQQQLSPQKKPLSNHTDGSGKRPPRQPQQLHQRRQQDQQKTVSKDSNSFVPLQALKKQRNVSKLHDKDPERSTTNASCTQQQAPELSTKQNKVCNASSTILSLALFLFLTNLTSDVVL